jgi:hypothetical protein
MTGLSANAACLHQIFSQMDVTFLTWCQQERDQPACTFTTDMDFGAKTTTATS